MKTLEILKSQEEILKKKYGVKRIGVFGSFARGEERKGSDVDILVELEKSYKTFDNFIELKFFLEELLGAPVDLVTVEALRSQIKPEVLQEVIYV